MSLEPDTSHVTLNKNHNYFVGFTEDAIDVFGKKLNDFSSNKIKEARLAEESERETGASSEITSSIVVQVFKSNRHNKNKRSKSYIFIKVISTLSLIIPGLLFRPDEFAKNDSNFLLYFMISFIVASILTISNVVLEIKD